MSNDQFYGSESAATEPDYTGSVKSAIKRRTDEWLEHDPKAYPAKSAATLTEIVERASEELNRRNVFRIGREISNEVITQACEEWAEYQLRHFDWFNEIERLRQQLEHLKYSNHGYKPDSCSLCEAIK